MHDAFRSQLSGTYLSQSTNLLHRHIEAIEVQRFSTHSRQVSHTHGLFLCEGQVAVHPHLPLWLTTQFIQLGNLLIGCSRRGGFLEGWVKIRDLSKPKPMHMKGIRTLLCPSPFERASLLRAQAGCGILLLWSLRCWDYISEVTGSSMAILDVQKFTKMGLVNLGM